MLTLWADEFGTAEVDAGAGLVVAIVTELAKVVIRAEGSEVPEGGGPEGCTVTMTVLVDETVTEASAVTVTI